MKKSWPDAEGQRTMKPKTGLELATSRASDF